MKNARVKLVQIKKAAMDGILPTAVFCVIGSAVVTVKTVIRGIFEAEVLSSIDHARNTPCLIDRNKIPFKELWREANFFADEIIFAVVTDFMQKIAEAECRNNGCFHAKAFYCNEMKEA